MKRELFFRMPSSIALFCTHLQAVDEPRVQRVGDELIDARVKEAKDCKRRPLAPRVDLETHEDGAFPWTNVHVAHVERTQAVEDDAHRNHPYQQEPHSVPLVIEELLEETHLATNSQGYLGIIVLAKQQQRLPLMTKNC